MAVGTRRRAINVSVRPDLADESREYNLNLSGVLEKALIAELKEARGRRWLAENADAIAAANRYVEEYGLPGEDIRAWR